MPLNSRRAPGLRRGSKERAWGVSEGAGGKARPGRHSAPMGKRFPARRKDSTLSQKKEPERGRKHRGSPKGATNKVSLGLPATHPDRIVNA